MKILFLSDINNVHTKKWVSGLSERGCEMIVFGLSAPKDDFYSSCKNVTIKHADFDNQKSLSILGKTKYLKVRGQLKKIVGQFNPDLIHAHYATSYGLLGSLLGFKPFLISVWGSDIYDFPNKSGLNKRILRRNLKKATHVFSTSYSMAQETEKYCDKEITVIPFGVDLNLFSPSIQSQNKDSVLTIGIVKTLEKNYGIDLLLHAFHAIKLDNPKMTFHLKIVGKGREEKNLKSLAENLGINKDVTFTGFVDNSLIPRLINEMDIVVIPSYAESFGVAAVEAAACEKPVIATNVGGLPEVVLDGETGLICEAGNSESIRQKIQQLIDDPELRKKMGAAGRLNAIEKYNWEKNVDFQISKYKEILRLI